MAPNHAIATRYGEQTQIETFLMSNICPQRPDPNRKVWKHLEATEADDYGNRFEEVWVIDGPIFPEKTFPSRLTLVQYVVSSPLRTTARGLAFLSMCPQAEEEQRGVQ